MISTEIQEAFAFEAAKMSVTTGRRVEEVYQTLVDNYTRALGLVQRADKQNYVDEILDSLNLDIKDSYSEVSENAKRFK